MTKTYCKVVGGVVVDRAIFGETIPADWPDRELWKASEAAQIGWAYVSGAFVAPPPPEPPPVDPLRPLQPYQFWAVVRGQGFEQPLKDWVEAIQDPMEKGLASAMLEFSLEFRRNHPMIEAARQAIGLTNEQLDALWAAGHEL